MRCSSLKAVGPCFSQVFVRPGLSPEGELTKGSIDRRSRINVAAHPAPADHTVRPQQDRSARADAERCFEGAAWIREIAVRRDPEGAQRPIAARGGIGPWPAFG